MKKVLVLILTYNGWDMTRECLESLASQVKCDFDVMIVDNHSVDDTVANLEGYAARVVANPVNMGYAAGNNVGLKIALSEGYEYVLLLNNDTVLHPECVAKLAEALDQRPAAGFVGGKVYFYDYHGRDDVFSSAGCYVDMYRGVCVLVGEKEPDTHQHDEMTCGGYANGCCIMVRAKTLREIGLLDETLFMYWEETDLCERGRRAGWDTLYTPHAIVWHKIGGSGGDPYLLARNKWTYMKRYANKKQYRKARTWFYLYEAPKTMANYLIIKRDLRRLEKYVTGALAGITSK